jgi:hypothetical protein
VIHERPVARVPHRPAVRLWAAGSTGSQWESRAFPRATASPPPDLLDAQVVKRCRRGHVVAVTAKAIFGEPDAITVRLRLRPTSTSINTSDVERGHLTWRRHNRRLSRKTKARRKEPPGLSVLALGRHMAAKHG